jgi:DNA-binding transcriptional ArsR family regulator
MDPDLASVAALIADRNRACLLQALLSGKPQSGSALAETAGISRALASAHLKKLVAGGLVRAERDGRRQLYSIAGPQVAEALELLMMLARPRQVQSLRDSSRARNLRWARMCYDHLAGAVGVAVTESLVAANAVSRADGGFALGPAAGEVLGAIGIDAVTLTGQRRRHARPVVLPCMDWSQRRDHVAGALGAVLARALVEAGWIHRQEGSRIVTVTAEGSAGLEDWLRIDLSALRSAA